MTALLDNQAFGVAVVALIVAITGYVQMRTKSASQAGAIDTLQKAAPSGGSGPTIVTVPVGGAAAGPDGSMLAAQGLRYPAWDQRSDVGVGGISATGQIDCGPESVAMSLRILTGVMVPASYLRWLVKGAGDSSLTSADDLVQMFAVNEHASHRRDAPFDALRVELGNSMAKGMPAIVLGRWLGPMGHWMCCERVDDARGVLFRDPWGGPQYWIAWDRIRSQYEGTYVHVDERASYAA